MTTTRNMSTDIALYWKMFFECITYNFVSDMQESA